MTGDDAHRDTGPAPCDTEPRREVPGRSPRRARPRDEMRHGRDNEPRRRRDDEPLLPDRSRDDSDIGWGESEGDRTGERTADWYRHERPPHHGG